MRIAYTSETKLAELMGFSQRQANRIIVALKKKGKIPRIDTTNGDIEKSLINQSHPETLYEKAYTYKIKGRSLTRK